MRMTSVEKARILPRHHRQAIDDASRWAAQGRAAKREGDREQAKRCFQSARGCRSYVREVSNA